MGANSSEEITTRAAVLREMGSERPYAKSKPSKIEELKIDGPGPSNVLSKIKAASLCHSDLSVINGSRKRPMPMASGHEAAGEVIAVGENVPAGRVEVGDHVVLVFSPNCGHCVPCAAGRPALCGKGAAANGKGELMDGTIRLKDADNKPVFHHLGDSAFSEYAVVAPESIVKIPKSLDWKYAALFGCAVMTGAGAAINTAQIKVGDTVAVVGLGGVGLAAIMGARAAGASQIIAVDSSEDKSKFARDIGATHTVNAASPDAIEQVKALADGVGVHHAIETAGVIKASKSAVAMTRPGGQTTTAGSPPGGAELGVDVASLVGQERRSAGSYMGSAVPVRDIPRFISSFQQGRSPVDKLSSATIKLDEINEGFDRLDRAEVIRQVISFD